MKIRPLTKRQEKQVLAAMLASLKELPDNSFFSRVKREAFWYAIPFSLVAIVLGVLKTQSWLAMCTTVGAMLVGVAFGVGAWRVTAAKQWPAVARCLDRDKIERQLRELDA